MAFDAASFGFGTPFQAQLDFFRQKLNLPTERWDDIIKQAHDKAFIVAGVANADLLQDLRNAMDTAMAEGTGLQAFRKSFKRIVKTRGWTGWTGEGSKAGEAWRTKIIYQTNMATSYWAGKYAQLTNPDFLAQSPNWEYVHDDSVQAPRIIHESWHGTVLPYNHPFWQTHFPPNGWGCQCSVRPRLKNHPLKQPPAGWQKIDPATGEQIGIDRGFGYAPGANVTTTFRVLVEQKMVNLDGDIGAILWGLLKEVLDN